MYYFLAEKKKISNYEWHVCIMRFFFFPKLNCKEKQGVSMKWLLCGGEKMKMIICTRD